MTDESTPPTDGRAIEETAEPNRLAEPVDTEQSPRLPFPVVGVGASAGGIEAFGEFLDAMRPDCGMAFVFILHLPPNRESLLAEILARRTDMPVREVEDDTAVEPNHVYVIRPGHVLTIREGRLRLGPTLGASRAANRPVDDFFRSLAEEQRERAVCVVMSGMGSNGTAGAQAIKAVGGLCVAQDPDSAQYASMPRHLIDAGYADYIARPADLPDILLTYADSPYARGGREVNAAETIQREQQHLREILAILRTRTRQDFNGYKKPTLLRRVQRRMGLARVANLAEYGRLLRQSPSEVTALADDLLIHVTGFFRDPEAWETLRDRVIIPLVETREPGGPVRAWVAACSSGEEAYSLAILMIEESERLGKRLDIKVFATDLAERTLAHARAGVYPGGIESEVSPERLRRFFSKEDEVYRVRQDLRDRVVFAPQNILQDPPFSRLDVATCRNLMIYLEPEVQQRVLSLLHFGLREGGALFLGTSETVTGADDLFEAVDKKARLYRRVGPTRHGSLDFPLPRPLLPGDLPPTPAAPPVPRRPASRAALAEITRQVLLDQHTPPAVTVDRDYHILYYHGDTRVFLQQLSGEPTRDLLLLARDGVRAAVRVALHRAAADNRREIVTDGWVESGPGRRTRVWVTASPVAADIGPEKPANPEYFVVSFEEREEITPPTPPAPPAAGAADELRRLRGELQSTIEELQTSNEELKASNEEVMSINEELQSSNEELETSKEEMQSLNEELRTVNTQLRAKMDEHQAASSDLTSLLTSTDIAVLFLDPQFRIRRFTPAVRDLLDLIPTDVGRPLANMARRFDDPHLDDDCRAVLEKLVPSSREVTAAGDRNFLRRVLPYRTVDNRIDGVVVTFVEITDRMAAERALAAEKEYAESIVQTLHEPLLVLNPDLTVRSVNPAFYTHFNVDPAETVGRRVYHLGNGQWDIPDLRTLLEDVLPDSNVFNDYEVTHEFEGLGRRVMLVNGRRLDHVQLILLGIRDITERKRAEDALRVSEERQAFLLRLSDALRPLGDPVEMQAEACRLLGEHLRAERAYFVEVDEGAGISRVRRDWRRPGSPSLAGEHRVADFGWVIPPMRAGQTLVIPDVNRSDLVPASDRAALAAVRIAAHVNVPLVKEGALVGAVCVTESAPRGWTAAEVELVRETAERIWAAVGRARAEEALAAELEAMTRLHELSNRLLTAPDLPTALGDVLDTAIALHGADMGTVQVYDPVADGLRYAAFRGFDAAALDAVPLIDRDFHSTCAAAIRSGKQVVVSDVAAAPEFADHAHSAAALGYRAAISTPLTTRQGEFRGVLTVHFRTPHPPSDRELRFADLYALLAAHLIERRRADEAVRAAEERLRQALRAARMGTWTLDPASGLHTRDESLNQLLGQEPVQTTRTFAEFIDLVHPDDRAAVKAAFDDTVRVGRPLALEFRIIRPDGQVRWLRDQGNMLGVPDTRRYMAGACVDVTDRKEAEAALQASEARLRAVAANLPSAAAFMVDHDLRYRLAEGEALRAAGFTPADLEGKTVAEAMPPDLLAEYLPRYQRALAGEAFRTEHIAHGRNWVTHGVPIRNAAGDVSAALAVSYDITDRVRAEDAVRASEERWRSVLESATDYAIITLDTDRNVTTWSPGAAAIFGYSGTEMTGQSADGLFTPEDRAAGEPEKEASAAQRDGRAADERWHIRKDGSRFYASGVLSPLDDGGSIGYVKVLRDLTERKRMEDELRDARDLLEARVAMRTAELVASQQRALQAERLAAIGQTVTTLAHEGRNALQRGTACLAMLDWRLQGNKEAVDLIQRAQVALGDLERLFNDIRDYASPIQLDPGRCDLREVWRESWEQVLVRHKGRDCKLEVQPGGPDTECEADCFRLRQVFANLFGNALEACSDPVIVRVTFEQAPGEGRPALRVTVRDNGPGFTPEQRQRALEPFYTTKPKGTGLGLAIVRRMVEAHGGTLFIEPDGPGAGITITLPLSR